MVCGSIAAWVLRAQAVQVMVLGVVLGVLLGTAPGPA